MANETDLQLDEHTTDTHGYSDLNFALFDLVGKQFSPRIRDLKSQRLYKVVGKEIREMTYPALILKRKRIAKLSLFFNFDTWKYI